MFMQSMCHRRLFLNPYFFVIPLHTMCCYCFLWFTTDHLATFWFLLTSFTPPPVFMKNVQMYIQMEIIVPWTPEYYHLDTIVNILLHLCVIYFLILFFFFFFAAFDHWMLQQASPKIKHILLQMPYLDKKQHTTLFSLYSSFSSCPVVPDFLQPELSQSSCIIFDCCCFSHF